MYKLQLKWSGLHKPVYSHIGTDARSVSKETVIKEISIHNNQHTLALIKTLDLSAKTH